MQTQTRLVRIQTVRVRRGRGGDLVYSGDGGDGGDGGCCDRGRGKVEAASATSGKHPYVQWWYSTRFFFL